MARNYECSECLHVQLVGVIDNGLSGYANPDAVCKGCGAVGRFHFAPGVHDSLAPLKAARLRERNDVMTDQRESDRRPAPQPGDRLVDESGTENCWLASAYSEADIRDEWDWLFEDSGRELHEVWFRPRWTTPQEAGDEDVLCELFGDHEMNAVDTSVVYDRAKPESPGAHRYLTTERVG